MAGIKGKSGGRRPGSGPKPKRGIVKVGDSFTVTLCLPTGDEIVLDTIVTEANPSVIVITLADGGSIRLAR